MAAFNKFNSFVEAVGQKKHNLNADVLKIYLSNVAPAAANSVKADIAEITAGNGYTAGGNQVPGNTFTQTAGLAKLLSSGNVVFTAVGGPIGPFRYAILYNDTALNDELIGWWDYLSSVTLQADEGLTVKINAVNGILHLGP